MSSILEYLTKRKNSLILTSKISIIFIFFVGCVAVPPSHQSIRKSQVFADTDPAVVWSSIINLFAENNWTITTLEKESGIIVSDWIHFSMFEAEDLADCGRPNWSSFPKGRSLRFNLYLKTTGQNPELIVNSHFWEKRKNWVTGVEFTAPCVSLGVLESTVLSQIFNQIQSSIKDPVITGGPMIR